MPDILQIPRQSICGKLLDLASSTGFFVQPATRLQRIRRKRYLAKLNAPQHQSIHIQNVLRHPNGRNFQTALRAWQHRLHNDSADPKLRLPPLPGAKFSPLRASVIINTVDRSTDLEITLRDLATSWDATHDELIIVLGPTTDDSESVIRHCSLPHQLIHCPEKNLAASRNLGLLAATGQFVVFIDDDASPEPNWLDALLAPLIENPATAVTAGFILARSGRHLLNAYVVTDTLGRSHSFDSLLDANAEITRLGNHRAFLTATGCNMAFKRQPLAAIGGFDPFFRYFLEETDAVLRLIHAGFHCQAAPQSRVRHRLGPNIARLPSTDLDQRLTIIRSQLHYIRKFGIHTFPAQEIEACIWSRVLIDLEKIAWDSASLKSHSSLCSEYQNEYLLSLTACI